MGGAGERLSALRDRVLDAARLQRHSLVLDLKAGSGLLTWEALRRAPEGSVWALAYAANEASALREMAARLPEIERPVVLQGTLAELSELLALRGEADVRFDAIVGLAHSIQDDLVTTETRRTRRSNQETSVLSVTPWLIYYALVVVSAWPSRRRGIRSASMDW